MNGASKKPTESADTLLAQAQALVQTSQPVEALEKAQRALAILQPTPEPTAAALPAINLLGEINIELGDADTAREYFTVAAALDPHGALPEARGGGPEKFFWLAQLCEEGGAESVQWYEAGADVLRRQIGELEGRATGSEAQPLLEEKRRKLANALCGIAEVYMTDLSCVLRTCSSLWRLTLRRWEEDAEVRCETLVTEALFVASDSAETLQTIASVRISQERYEEARDYLARSMELWADLQPEDPRVPDFPTRVSLSRLLMEAQMEEEAIEVLERLVTEDDSSVEAWYLGGWCLHLLAEKRKPLANGSANSQEGVEDSNTTDLLRASRDWLRNSLKLYQMLDYEDERLRDHAVELIEGLDNVLGPATADDQEGDGEDGWEDADEDSAGDEDEKMQGT